MDVTTEIASLLSQSRDKMVYAPLSLGLTYGITFGKLF